MSVALITGASRGLGQALARELSARGWSLVLDARGAEALDETVSSLRGGPVVAVVGDVSSPDHRGELAAAVAQAGRLDLLVNNASHLGPSPQPQLADYPLDELARVYEVDVLAPVALTQLALPWLVAAGGVRDQRHLRRRGRGVRGLGRLRVGQGGARPGHRRPGGRAAGHRLLRVRPGRHAHPDAPAGLPGRGHLRPARAGDGRAGAAAADRRATAQRSLPSSDRAVPRRRHAR